MEETIDETAGGQMRNLDPEVYDLDVMSGLFHEYKGPLGENKGIFYSTFKKYSQLNDLQKSKTEEWFARLPMDSRKTLIETTRARTQSKREEEASKAKRNVRTNKNDVCRLFHLRIDPRLMSAWNMLYTGLKTRSELDARNSPAPSGEDGRSCRDQLDAWQIITDAFNDYEMYIYQNQTIAYEQKDGKSVPVDPFTLSDPQYSAVFDFVKELNPSDDTRKVHIRDKEIIKNLWRTAKGVLAKAFERFYMSGKQSGNGIDNWEEWLELFHGDMNKQRVETAR